MEQFTILYTANLRGDLERLPRLYTFFQQLKASHGASTLLLDLGNACADDIWHCDATAGRSTVIVMDGMGYHAVNVSDFMGERERDSLRGSISTGLVTERHMWRYFVPPVRDEDIVIAGQPTPAMNLCIIAAPAAETTLDNRMLHLQTVAQNQVGMCEVDLTTQTILKQDILRVPDKLRPDATIAASVELIEEEARQALKRK